MHRTIISVCDWIKESEKVFKVLGLTFFAITFLVGIFWIFGRDVESVAFVLGCISSSMFGVVEVAHYLVPDRKLIRDMSIDELIEFIKNSDASSNWRRFSSCLANEVVLIEDPRLRLTMWHDERGIQNDEYTDSWANSFPDPRATGFWIEITYDRALFERKILVSIDGGRAMIPPPKTPIDLEINEFEYKIAQLFNEQRSLDDYLDRTRISVV